MALFKRIKYRIVDALDRSPRKCRAKLVCWAEYGHPLSDCGIDSHCVWNLPEDGRCYCGKLDDSKREAV